MAYKDKQRQIDAANAYNKENYDRITITVPKGNREEIQAAAKAAEESTNEYIKRAIAERMREEGR